MAREWTDSDVRLMKRALALAGRGRGAVEPNPMVGCVLARGQRVVGEGYHRRFGGPHAEVEALASAGRSARSATAYVTLEPCCHFGKTPPCTDALREAGVRRVVAALSDPFPKVAGGGLAILRRAGIKVEVGLLREAAAELNAPYLTRLLLKRPFVIAKWAQSLDGKIATRTGDSKWITGQAARRQAHRLRSRVDAVMVGLNTVLADDPLLTARDVPVRRVATRVVMDTRLRIPFGCQLVATADEAPTLVFTAVGERGPRRATRARLQNRGVDVVTCRKIRGRIDLRHALVQLADRGCTNVLVEGGGELIGSLIDAGLVDQAQVFTAPMIVGGRQARTGCAGLGVALISRAIRARSVLRKRVGEDELTVVRLTELPDF